MSNSNLLYGKVALITGCNRGIGKIIMETFAQNGANIWACARKESKEFHSLIDNLRGKYGIKINPLYFDLMVEAEIKEKLSSLVAQKEKIDILVNNAGVAHGAFFQMTSVSKMKEIFDVNFFSQMLVTQYIIKIMIKQNSGNIINISSIAGLNAEPGYLSYGSSKAALIYATKILAKEMASKNIRVNGIAPGLAETQMAALMETKAKAKMISTSAMKRMAKPQEIANVALFLASDMSTFVNGEIIRVDGGD
jgi:3-oxoacyl-[acyl-carrier protein] reductase